MVRSHGEYIKPLGWHLWEPWSQPGQVCINELACLLREMNTLRSLEPLPNEIQTPGGHTDLFKEATGSWPHRQDEALLVFNFYFEVSIDSHEVAKIIPRGWSCAPSAQFPQWPHLKSLWCKTKSGSLTWACMHVCVCACVCYYRAHYFNCCS